MTSFRQIGRLRWYILGCLLCFLQQTAHADLWAHVDERGVNVVDAAAIGGEAVTWAVIVPVVGHQAPQNVGASMWRGDKAPWM